MEQVHVAKGATPLQTAARWAVLGRDLASVRRLHWGSQHLDQLARRYTRHPHYYGYVYLLEQQAQETRIICRIHATKITLDAIHT